MKKVTLFTLLVLISTGFASAQNSFSNLLNQIDQSMVILSSIFLLSFALLFLALSRAFKDNKSIAGIVSAIVAFGITYGLNKTGFDFEGFFYNIGISEGVLMTIIPIIILAGMVFAIVKLKSGSLLVFGGLLILLSFFVYEKVILITLGAILLVVGLVLIGRKKKHEIGGSAGPHERRTSFSGPRENWVSGRQAAQNRAAEKARYEKARAEREQRRHQKLREKRHKQWLKRKAKRR